MHLLKRTGELSVPLLPYLDVDRTRVEHECWVMGHMVAGLDGTAAIAGKVGPLSTGPDQALFRSMRRIADVVMIGAETVRREKYGVVRLDEAARRARESAGRPPTPPVAVVSRSLDLDWGARIFTDAPQHARTRVITCESSDPELRARAAEVADVIVAGSDRVDPAEAFTALAARGHQVVLCEGGPTWLGEIVAADRLDELCLSISPLIGGDPLPVCVNPVGSGIAEFDLVGTAVEESTLFLRYEKKMKDGRHG
ncbi:riboflavin biosynthesis pyrimidine reductase [Brevibacterium sanguinis]|uniref:Riboflavin biosynthesis pyrimidine reductase n=2 Tax=Brevibacterium TaxID=1696 RepID=A0A366IND2_9MICO|nr:MULTISPECIES: dihydrofolate reductase family protein [Brevibacterium]RBP66208.1 riboflavin biosynthesis pyrimidine reductase [Brevibacterium sanguinis]RBP72859.1 riboflavin biosynthesis pyrimidine reductase [Brevibacterium celere]